MNRWRMKFTAAVLLFGLLASLIPTVAYAATSPDVVIGNNYTLEAGNTLNDDLFIVGGSVSLLKGSVVNGSIFLVGGSLDAAGTVNGDITILGGALNLSSTLILNGNLTTAGASVNRESGAQILGQIYSGENSPTFVLPGGIRIDTMGTSNHPLLRVASFFLRLFLWVLVAMVAAMLLPVHLDRVSTTALTEPLVTGIFGLLTALVAPVVIVLVALTICLIPVSLLAAFLLAIAWIFGLVSLGNELGTRISRLFNQSWHPVLRAGAGMAVLMVVLNGLELMIPCVGVIPKILVGLLGLGAVLLTQFGTKPYSSRPGLPGGSPTSEIAA